MRHVSRTHRFALDWLFDRMNLDPKIQIKYIHTKHQLEDILTQGNFTRDDWNNLLYLINISDFSSASCPQTMSTRVQEGAGEERVTAKSKRIMNLVSKTAGKSSMSLSPSASNSPGRLKAQSQQLCLFMYAGKPAPKDSAENTQNFIDEDWPHNFQISHSPSVNEQMKKLFLNQRQKFGGNPDHELLTLHVNSLIWRMFISATMDAN